MIRPLIESTKVDKQNTINVVYGFGSCKPYGDHGNISTIPKKSYDAEFNA
jgi:hypothetical protein